MLLLYLSLNTAIKLGLWGRRKENENIKKVNMLKIQTSSFSRAQVPKMRPLSPFEAMQSLRFWDSLAHASGMAYSARRRHCENVQYKKQGTSGLEILTIFPWPMD